MIYIIHKFTTLPQTFGWYLKYLTFLTKKYLHRVSVYYNEIFIKDIYRFF